MIIKDFIKFFLYLNLKIKIRGKKFIVPIVKGAGFQNLKLKNDWLLLLLAKVKLPDNSSFIDVGVNVGQTLLKFRSYFENPYIGFEPNANCVLYTRELIRINNFKNVSIFPVGLSDKDEIAVLYSGRNLDNCCTDSTIISDLRPNHYTEYDKSFVPTYRFDNLNILKPGETVSMIKIDAEGAELDILSGMTETIKRFQPLIICEVLDYNSEQTSQLLQDRADKLHELVKKLDYKIYRITHDVNNISFKEVSKIELTLWTAASLETNDYLFIPSLGEFSSILL